MYQNMLYTCILDQIWQFFLVKIFGHNLNNFNQEDSKFTMVILFGRVLKKHSLHFIH